MFCCGTGVDNLNILEEIDYRQFKIIIDEVIRKIEQEIEEKEEEFVSPTKEDFTNSRVFHGSINNQSAVKTPQESQILDTNYLTEEMKSLDILQNSKKEAQNLLLRLKKDQHSFSYDSYIENIKENGLYTLFVRAYHEQKSSANEIFLDDFRMGKFTKNTVSGINDNKQLDELYSIPQKKTNIKIGKKIKRSETIVNAYKKGTILPFKPSKQFKQQGRRGSISTIDNVESKQAINEILDDSKIDDFLHLKKWKFEKDKEEEKLNVMILMQPDLAYSQNN